MHANVQLVTTLYTALNAHNGEAMAACYHPEATFSDPVFTDLRGDQVGNMWRMLCHRGKDLAVTCDGVRADDSTGQAHWEATYTFSATGRQVHNAIDAAFTFEDGLILTHRDRFSLWRWAGMALGLKGRLLGGLPFVQKAIRKQARDGLSTFVQRRPNSA